MPASLGYPRDPRGFRGGFIAGPSCQPERLKSWVSSCVFLWAFPCGRMSRAPRVRHIYSPIAAPSFQPERRPGAASARSRRQRDLRDRSADNKLKGRRACSSVLFRKA